MDARSLMLGDYVINTEFGKNEIAQVEIIEPTRVWLKDGRSYVPICYIEPVPITAEILEKNGFVQGEKDKNVYIKDVMFDNGVQYVVWYYFYKEQKDGVESLLMCEVNFYGGVNKIHLCNISFVSQLQHALSMCGITKNIQL